MDKWLGLCSSSDTSTGSGEQEICKKKDVSHGPFETEFTAHNTSRSTVKSVMVELRWCTNQLMLSFIFME